MRYREASTSEGREIKSRAGQEEARIYIYIYDTRITLLVIFKGRVNGCARLRRPGRLVGIYYVPLLLSLFQYRM